MIVFTINSFDFHVISLVTDMCMMFEGPAAAATVEQLQLASKDDLTLLSSDIMASEATRNATEGCFNASFISD